MTIKILLVIKLGLLSSDTLSACLCRKKKTRVCSALYFIIFKIIVEISRVLLSSERTSYIVSYLMSEKLISPQHPTQFPLCGVQGQ